MRWEVAGERESRLGPASNFYTLTTCQLGKTIDHQAYNWQVHKASTWFTLRNDRPNMKNIEKTVFIDIYQSLAKVFERQIIREVSSNNLGDILLNNFGLIHLLE